jgi:predicted metal-binding protein
MPKDKKTLYCKYCKTNDHLIDTCPSIMCKTCNKYGHPHWKCTNTPVVKETKPVNKKPKNNIVLVVEEQTNKKVIETTNNKFTPLMSEYSDKNSIDYFLQFRDQIWGTLL